MKTAFPRLSARGTRRRRAEAMKSLQHTRAVYPLTEARVLLTGAATDLI